MTTVIEKLVRPFVPAAGGGISTRRATAPGGDDAVLEWGNPGSFSDKKEVFGQTTGFDGETPPHPHMINVDMTHSPQTLIRRPINFNHGLGDDLRDQYPEFIRFRIPPVSDEEKTPTVAGLENDTTRGDPNEGIEDMSFELTFDASKKNHVT